MAPNLPQTPSEKGIDYIIMPRDAYSQALEDVYYEIRKAKAKHPGNYHSAHHGYAILLEEVDETWDEVKRDDLEKAKKEITQVAAVAARFIAEL